jgi:hypothetical protein
MMLIMQSCQRIAVFLPYRRRHLGWQCRKAELRYQTTRSLLPQLQVTWRLIPIMERQEYKAETVDASTQSAFSPQPLS